MFSAPLWLAGFRPFFTLAFASGALLPVAWALSYSGAVPLPLATHWHAHEMLFGFGWAVLGGFLLTASKNWVDIRGLHGGPLAVAALLWVLERGAIFLPTDGGWGRLRLVLLNACVSYVGGYVVWSLLRHRSRDTFRDNGFFVLGLPLLLVAKNLLTRPETWPEGTTLSIGIFRLAFAVMFERTLPQFMKNGMGVTLPRSRWLDLPIKLLVLLAAFEAFWPPRVAVSILVAAAALLLARLVTWKPRLGVKTFGIAVMYLGYLGLVIHLALAALRHAEVFTGLGALSTHAFTFGTMGTVIPAMLIRICQGHTGRKPGFALSDRVAIGLLWLGGFFRLVATQLWPDQYSLWITLAGVGWSGCFIVIGVRLAPLLFQPRVDGRVH